MEAIEAVTSKRKTIRLKCGHEITCKVWNDTVANLSLMALGSSAPEIMLNVIEIVLRDFFSGDLGPSTIVGSAAFNLMVIIAVCVYVIPEGEARTIRAVEPFMVTAFFSIFAYVWMVFVISVWSVDVITIPEAFITLSFFPILITMAYLADIGWFTRKKEDDESLENIRLIQTKALEAGFQLTDEETRMLARINDHEDMSWAEKRVEASPVKVHVKEQDLSVGFMASRYCFTPGGAQLILTVEKFGSNEHLLDTHVAFEYRTSDGCNMRADDGDYTASTGRGEIPPGDLYGEIIINRNPGAPNKEMLNGHLAAKKVGQDADNLHNLHFFVDLITADKLPASGGHGRRRSVASGSEEEEGIHGTPLHIAASGRRAQVSIADLEGPGMLRMEHDTDDVPCPDVDTKARIKVRRVNGVQGEIACSFYIVDGTAKAGIHYLATEGELVFGTGVLEKTIEVPILKKLATEVKDQFQVRLEAMPGRPSVLIEGQTICTVIIHDETDVGVAKGERVLNQLQNGFDFNFVVDNAKDWADQFVSAMHPCGDDDLESASVADWTLHVFALPWKILCAFIPPPSYCGGWLCFYFALLMIGCMTILIGDLATLLGCVMEINSSITAITIVALGTSLPDTFASKVAAVDDPTADAAIGNVTGSNSVNVFLGLGLPWVIGSLYWAANGKSTQWIFTYPEQHAKYANAQLVVLSGDLTFSVCCFTLCAVVVLTVLMYRRKAFQAELGGPVGPKTNTSIFFVLLWIFYVSMASWKVINGVVSTAKCIEAILVGVCCVLLGNVLVAGTINYLWFREEQRKAEMKELIDSINQNSHEHGYEHRPSQILDPLGHGQAGHGHLHVPPLKAGQRLSTVSARSGSGLPPGPGLYHPAPASYAGANGLQRPRGSIVSAFSGSAQASPLDSRTEELLAAVPRLAEGLRLKLPEAIISLRQHLEALSIVCSALERGIASTCPTRAKSPRPVREESPKESDSGSNGVLTVDVPAPQNKVQPSEELLVEAAAQ